MENEQCGAFVGDKAKMRLQGCQSTCNRSDGFCAERGGSLKLSRCTSDSDRYERPVYSCLVSVPSALCAFCFWLD